MCSGGTQTIMPAIVSPLSDDCYNVKSEFFWLDRQTLPCCLINNIEGRLETNFVFMLNKSVTIFFIIIKDLINNNGIMLQYPQQQLEQLMTLIIIAIHLLTQVLAVPNNK